MNSYQNVSSGLKRVAAYCRVSTDKEDQANSFEAQRHYFRTCIEGNPAWELQEIYADEGLSGTSTRNRTYFNRMIQAARDGKIDLIITKEVSRFARNTVDTLEYIRELRKKGVGVIFLSDNINSLDGDFEFRLTIMASLAQEESRKTSQRVKWGQTRSMEQGVVFGGSLLGYDVVRGKMKINSEGARTVRCIFHKYLNEQKGTSVIARELQKEGILSSRGNLKWTASTVLKILKNEKYCGDLIQKKTYTPDFLSHEKKYNKGQEPFVILRDHHEPIIDRKTWDAAQQELKRRCRNGTKIYGHGNRYPLSGKIKCSECGSSFLPRTKKTREGDSYRVWRCGKATIEGKLHTDANGDPVGCDVGRQIRETTALDMLRCSVQAVRINSKDAIRNLTCVVEEVLKDSQNSCMAELSRLERELEGEKEKKCCTLEAFLDRTISKSDFQFLNQRCDERIAHLTDQLSDAQQEINTALEDAETAIHSSIHDIVTGERAAAEFFSRLLNQMIVHKDGRVEVALNFLPARWVYTLDTVPEDEGR